MNISRKLAKVVGDVVGNKHSDFYRKKYKKNKVRIDNVSDFEALPFLRRKELIMTAPYERLFLNPKVRVGVYYSSGTTDKPLCVFQHQYNFPRVVLERLNALKINNLLILRPVWVGQASLVTWSDFPGQMVLGDVQNLGMSAKAAAQVEIDSLNTTATGAIYFAPYLRKYYDLKKIKWLWLGGEAVSSEKLGLLRKIYPNAYFEITLVSVETFNRAYRCKYLYELEPNIYHPMDDEFYFEIYGRRQTKQNGVGELVVTNLSSGLPFPLVRYRTGDLVEIREEKCKCGHKRILKMLGRSEFDSVRVHGVTIYAQELEKAVIKSGIWPRYEYQLLVNEKISKNGKAFVGLTLIVDSDVDVSDALISQFCANFYLNNNLKLSDLIKKDMFKFKVRRGSIETKFKARRIVSI